MKDTNNFLFNGGLCVSPEATTMILLCQNIYPSLPSTWVLEQGKYHSNHRHRHRRNRSVPIVDPRPCLCIWSGLYLYPAVQKAPVHAKGINYLFNVTHDPSYEHVELDLEKVLGRCAARFDIDHHGVCGAAKGGVIKTAYQGFYEK